MKIPITEFYVLKPISTRFCYANKQFGFFDFHFSLLFMPIEIKK